MAQNDLAEFAYNGDRNRVERDIENLQRQGLAEVKTIPDADHNAIKVVTLTKEGNKFLRRGGILEPGQRTYHGLKKPNEAAHDADLYRLYHKVSDEIESQGGRVVAVRLDYELKDELYSRIARASKSRQQSQQASSRGDGQGVSPQGCGREDSNTRPPHRVCQRKRLPAPAPRPRAGHRPLPAPWTLREGSRRLSGLCPGRRH